MIKAEKRLSFLFVLLFWFVGFVVVAVFNLQGAQHKKKTPAWQCRTAVKQSLMRLFWEMSMELGEGNSYISFYCDH